MMGEERQERAALYALGLLDADEAGAFEHELAADGELRALTADLRETVALLAWAETNGSPPPELKARVLAAVAEETKAPHPATGEVIVRPSAWTRWAPWAAAAVLTLFAGALAWSAADGRKRSHRAVQAEQTALLESRALAERLRASEARNSLPPPPALQQVAFCALEPVPAAQRTGPQAAVLWDAAHRRGRLRITQLAPAGKGQDYQLWTVEDGRKDPVSAGVVKVGPDGSAEIGFQPQNDDGKAPVVAFALSVERAGGVPKNEGPILYLGKL